MVVRSLGRFSVLLFVAGLGCFAVLTRGPWLRERVEGEELVVMKENPRFGGDGRGVCGVFATGGFVVGWGIDGGSWGWGGRGACLTEWDSYRAAVGDGGWEGE